LTVANKQTFTPAEWTNVMESVALAGMAVTAADPSGLIGLLQESFASAGALIKAKGDPAANELVKSVVAEFETSEGRTKIREALKARFAGAKPADVSQRSLDALRQVSRLLDSKAPQDAAAFKQLLSTISSKVADAAKEGSVLGFGGQKVSDAEKATLSQIAQALGVAA
jgi:membrane-bound lytic murein transglycosylase B